MLPQCGECPFAEWKKQGWLRKPWLRCFIGRKWVTPTACCSLDYSTALNREAFLAIIRIYKGRVKDKDLKT